ncbi:MAG: hypothetical protein KME22_06600 [Hassallia sp. WJT32-NPBG1]|jgi:hypothetical protein|nr:hypothetical protein [Hassallia sp. WJT32-NPBG1]
MFHCRIILLESGQEFKVVGDYSDLRLQVLPAENQYFLFKQTNSKYFLTKVEVMLPVVDAEFGIGMRFFVSLRIINPAPKFMNLVDLGDE